MRGDSLRDLYAKTLAVMGLGLLAGAGAVVDYWPVGNTMPALRAAGVPMPAVPVLVQNLSQYIPAPDLVPRPPAPARIRPSAVGSAVFLKASLATAARPIDSSVAPAPVPAWDAVPVDATFIDLLVDSSIDIAQMTAAPAPPQPAPASPGFLSGALKKTRDSIVRTGAVTRSSITDAFRGVVGAFKKVSPF